MTFYKYIKEEMKLKEFHNANENSIIVLNIKKDLSLYK